MRLAMRWGYDITCNMPPRVRQLILRTFAALLSLHLMGTVIWGRYIQESPYFVGLSPLAFVAVCASLQLALLAWLWVPQGRHWSRMLHLSIIGLIIVALIGSVFLPRSA